MPPNELLYRTFTVDDLSVRADGDGRNVLVRAVPFDTELHLGGDLWEVFRLGAFRGQTGAANRVTFTAGHPSEWVDPNPLSWTLGAGRSMVEKDDGLHVEFRISRTAMGDDALTLIADGAVDQVSIGFKPLGIDKRTKRKDGGVLIERVKAHLDHVALVRRGAYGDAPKPSKVLSVRADSGPRPMRLADLRRRLDRLDNAR